MSAHLTDQLLLERPALACRLGLPTEGGAIRQWLDPMAVWGSRLTAVAEKRGNELAVGRARRGR